MDDDDYLGREAARRERDHERRMLEHPDPRDPEHPEDACSECGAMDCGGRCYGDDMMGASE